MILNIYYYIIIFPFLKIIASLLPIQDISQYAKIKESSEHNNDVIFQRKFVTPLRFSWASELDPTWSFTYGCYKIALCTLNVALVIFATMFCLPIELEPIEEHEKYFCLAQSYLEHRTLVITSWLYRNVAWWQIIHSIGTSSSAITRWEMNKKERLKRYVGKTEKLGYHF